MKRLIDADALVDDLDMLVSNAIKSDAKLCFGDIRAIIRQQKTVICVSDDFGCCNKVLSCDDIICGGDCIDKS